MIEFYSQLSITHYWNMLVAALCCGSCALVGSFLVLRSTSLLGDAISHAVLPGLVVGYMLSGSRELWPMLIGAIAAGLLTSFLTESLQKAKVEAGASMGVVFTSLFALGVILIHQGHSQIDLDPSCVLYGQLLYIGVDIDSYFGLELPRALPMQLILFVCLSLMVVAFFKELRLASFDPALSTTLGISATAVHYLLMSMVSVTTVASFEAVGSILVIAMLVVPGATAHMLTERLPSFLLVALFTGWLSAIGGYSVAVYWDLQAAGMMAIFAGGLFTLATVFSPKYGLVSKAYHRFALQIRITEEDYLARIFRLVESDSSLQFSAADMRSWSDSKSIRGGSTLRRLAVSQLKRQKFIQFTQGTLELTKKGSEKARSLVQGHRLWESYLAEKLSLPLDHLHDPAHRVEHFLSADIKKKLSSSLEAPTIDPHGKKIPSDTNESD